jgi:hypothetical protein
MISRRAMLAGGAIALAGSGPLSRVASAADKPFLPQGLPEGVYDTATLEALPGKKPLIKLTYRPPNYETPLSHFTSEFTPNKVLFRSLPPRRNPGRNRRRAVEAKGRRRGRRETPGIELERTTVELRRCGSRRSMSMLGQSPRLFGAARGRSAMGTWRRRQCAMARGAAERTRLAAPTCAPRRWKSS